MQIVDKLWGREVWIRNDNLYCMKELTLNQGFQCSLHMHKIKTETFYVAHGSITLQILQDDGSIKDIELTEGMTESWYHIDPGVYHRFIGIDDFNVIIECSTEHFEDDSYRKEKSRKL